MKPVDQTKEGHPDGDCLAACVASVFEVPLESLPDFAPVNDNWWGALQKWIQLRGLMPLEIKAHGSDIEALEDCWHLIAGLSPRGKFMHSVVGQRGELVHDPHPSRGGLESKLFYMVFVAINPERMTTERKRDDKQ